LTASATPVSDETKTGSDDVFGCCVLVTIPGDVNGDFTVGPLDFVILIRAYGSKPSASNWNSNADIDRNGAVGLADLVILAQHYGQHYP